MAIDVTVTRHGAAALDALAAAVRRAKGDDPLTPVTVIVPTNTVGVMARRALGRRGGAAAVEVLTLFRVAELLGAPALRAQGRRPVSTPIVDVAVGQVLDDDPGAFESVRRHPSTVVALRDVHRQLRVAGPAASVALARTRRGAEPARIAAAVADRLARAWYDEGDLLAEAGRTATAGLPQRFARTVVHLPERVRPLERALLAALAGSGHVELIVALTGDPAADGSIHDLVEQLTGRPLEQSSVTGPGEPPDLSKVEIVSTTDADDEVRLAVRAIVDAARTGTRFDHMALLWPTDRPYARIVEHQLHAAGIPWNGRPGTQMAELIAPRLLTALLDLDRRGLRRSNLMTLLGDVPAAAGPSGVVPSSRWERIGRRAGIVREEDWERGLALARAEVASTRPWDSDAVESLAAFVAELQSALGRPDERRPWSEWAEWCRQRLDRWLTPRRLDRLQGDERVAWELTQRVLDRLGHLDSVGRPVTRAEFRATFVAELDVTPARHGTVGDGVHVGGLTGAVGLDVDLAVVVGCADGLLPPPPPVDPLLGEAERLAAGLDGATARVQLVHRHFLAVVGTTPGVLITVPRGDLRVDARHHPSRWLEAMPAVLRTMDSHAHALSATEFPVTEAEHRVRDLWSAVRAGQDVRQHPLVRDDRALARSIALCDNRASEVLTAYDGDLSALPPPPLTGPVSPTQIELWRSCPHAYFVRHLLGVRPIEEPEAIEVVSPLDRGHAMHEVMDRLHQQVLSGALPAPGPTGWDDVHRTALVELAIEVTAELQAAGRSGRPASWANERSLVLEELDEWLTHDAARWDGRTIARSESEFGGPDSPTEVTLPDGRVVRFVGRIDRIDRLADGTVLVVDHKTGKADELGALTAEDPTLGGTRFQLPVYAAAAAGLIPDAPAPVRAEYSFLRRGGFARIGITFDDAVWAKVAAALAEVVDGVEAGFFPAVPEPPEWHQWVGCWYCEPDGLGTAERWADWQRKQLDPRLARWFPRDDAEVVEDQ